ncbi:MAG: hypothetical protein RR968_03480 [Vagococcus sp.]
MQKKTIDSIVLVIFIGLIGVVSGSTNIKEMVMLLLPLILIVGIGLNNTWSIKVNFLIFFVIYFIAFSFDPGTVDWTSYLLYAILSGVLSLLLSLGLASNRKAFNGDPLRGSLLKYLYNKWPQMSGVTLFLVDSLVSFGLLSLLFFILFQPLKPSLLVILAVVVCYFSATDTYFYIVKPRKEKS